jgi:hypothetical protein
MTYPKRPLACGMALLALAGCGGSNNDNDSASPTASRRL